MKSDDSDMNQEETINRSDENDQIIEDIVKDLKELSKDDLIALYQSLSKKLPSRNGMDADYNPVLTSLMGCNTNSLFLGSREQRKGALFYIGPYICKK